MTKHNQRKANRLEELLPEGLLVDAAWLTEHGFSTSLRSQYVTSGRLEQPARRVYRRPHGTTGWQQVVVSLQALLRCRLVVGGRTSLELQGFAHYLKQRTSKIYLYGPKAPPTWLKTLSVGAQFFYHNDRKLFRKETVGLWPASTGSDLSRGRSVPNTPNLSAALKLWREGDKTFAISSPERALLELLDELPERESFEQVDQLMGSLSVLSPKLLQTLLQDCRNVKVKRLFFLFADRHKHAWLKHLNRNAIDLGKGKRMLVRGGKLNKKYQITVPEDLNAF